MLLVSGGVRVCSECIATSSGLEVVGARIPVVWEQLPGCVQFKLSKLLSNLHRLPHHTPQLIIIATLWDIAIKIISNFNFFTKK